MYHHLPKLFLVTTLSPSVIANNLSINTSLLETVVITATREEQRKMDVPESINSFNRETIDAISPSHPSEILNRAAGVHINNLGGESHMTAIRQPITTRGVYLFLEDGVPVRPPGFFNHNALYEVNIPQSGRLEVTKGPGSALYGSDAIGGIINSISRKPPATDETMINFEAGSYGWFRGLISTGTTQGNHGINLSLNITDNEGYRDEADYNRTSLNTRWDLTVNDTFYIKTLLSYTDVDQSGVSSLEESDYKNDDKKNRFQDDVAFSDVKALRLSTELSWQFDAATLVTLTPYFRDNTTSMSPSWMVTYDPNERENEFQSYGFLSKYRVKTTDHFQWIIGLDIDYTPSSYVEEAISHTFIDDLYISYVRLGNKNYDFEAEQTSISPYAHIELQLMDKLLASLGVRYDYFDIDYDDQLASNEPTSIFIPQLGRPVTHLRADDQSVSFEEFSPKLGLVYQISDQHAAYFNYRQAFSIPSVGTLFRSGTTQNTENLEPIKADSYEVGIRGEAATWLFYELALYELAISDDIVSVVNGFQRNRFNAGKTNHKGIELSLSGQITDEFNYAFAITKSDQEYGRFSYTCCFPSQNIDVSGNDVGKAPETIGNLTLAYAPLAISGLRIELEWDHLGKYYTDETNTSEYAGHDLYNLRVNYHLNGSLEIYGRIQNLSDERYSTYTSNQVGDPDISYRPGNPRSVYAGFRYTF